MINELIKKLRKAADALDDLLDSNPSHNGKAKQSIEKAIVKTRTYKKRHWTQLPKNRVKLKNVLNTMRSAKKAKLRG